MRRGIFSVLLLLLTIGARGASFERPSENERLRALGNLFEESESVRPLYTPDIDFPPIPHPGPNDWLANHLETGQTFDEYRDFSARTVDATRRVIYLLPLGEFPEETTPPFEQLRAYAAAFFQLEVRLLPAYYPHDLEFSPRRNSRSHQRQILATDVIAFLKAKLPADGCCLLGITMEDLYPARSWNYVFGQASLEDRVGIYSLARYEPTFWGDARGEHYRDLILQRACKVLAHETAHMFGLHHCIYFECLVNGANHLVETDGQPQHPCPICLRKLHHAIGFDPVRRYTELAQFYRGQRWYEELDWTNRQLARISSAVETTAQPKPSDN